MPTSCAKRSARHLPSASSCRNSAARGRPTAKGKTMATLKNAKLEPRAESTENRVWPLAVLVVDDDEPTRHILASALRTLGHECREAAGGAEALHALEHRGADVVLCDWEMP